MIVTTTDRLTEPPGAVLRVAGEVDTYAADDLRDHFRRLDVPRPGVVVVDLGDVTFMSCSALRVLGEARARFGSRLLLGRRSRVVDRLFEITGLSSSFDVVPGDGADAWPDATHGTASAEAPRTSDTEARAWTFSRTDVERASSLLKAVHGCDAGRAWSMLTLAAARSGIPVGELVDLLIRPRRDPDRPPSSAAAVAALTVLTRRPVEDPAVDGGRRIPSRSPDTTAAPHA